MFENFFYALKDASLPISIGEWIDFQDALNSGLGNSSLDDFYYLSRMILVKDETNFDRFDSVFDNVFRGATNETPISKAMLSWLESDDNDDILHEHKKDGLQNEEQSVVDKEEVEETYKKRKEDQDSEHHGGTKWIGTMGKTSFGNSGANIGGLRVAGKSGHQSAFAVIGEKKYHDFRDDRVMDNRQFQQALRKLRQFSSKLDIPKSELDINGTIDKTCNQGGMLHVVMDRPRKNAIKLLLLMDSGGTMIPYTTLINELFQSVNKSNHFKDVKVYFFHNCIYSHVYKTPECENGDWIETEWMLRNLDKDYKVIIVGDAAMAPEELYSDSGNYRGPNGGLSGYEWLSLLKRSYKKIVWLNPKLSLTPAPWKEAEAKIIEMFPMYRLTVSGLNEAMGKLIENK